MYYFKKETGFVKLCLIIVHYPVIYSERIISNNKNAVKSILYDVFDENMNKLLIVNKIKIQISKSQFYSI